MNDTELSPFRLFQERYRGDPWKMLVCCVALNRTDGSRIGRAVAELFREFPDAASVVADREAAKKRIAEILRHTGLQNVKAARIVALSEGWVRNLPVEKIRGIGQYARESYAVFIEGRLDVDPSDEKVRMYVEWVRKRKK